MCVYTYVPIKRYRLIDLSSIIRKSLSTAIDDVYLIPGRDQIIAFINAVN